MKTRDLEVQNFEYVKEYKESRMEVQKKLYNDALPADFQRDKKRIKIKVAKQKTVAKDIGKSYYKTVCGLVFVFFITMAILATYGSTIVSMKNEELNNIEVSRAELEGHRDYLIMNLEPYKESARIEEIARSSLSMDYPRKDQYIEMDLEGKTKDLDLSNDKADSASSE